MKKKIAGYTVHAGRFGVVLGFCVNQPKDVQGILWAGGTGWMSALFKTTKQAQKAVDKTEQYAISEGMTRDNRPIWFEHHIEPVREA